MLILEFVIFFLGLTLLGILGFALCGLIEKLIYKYL